MSDETSLNYLVQHTCYQRSDELIQNIQYFLSSGRLNKAQAFIDGKAPYDPEYCFLPNEDLLYPAEELRSIRAAGLVPQIIPYFMGANRPYLRVVNKAFGIIPKLSLQCARALHILATKE